MVLFCSLIFLERRVIFLHQALYRKWRPATFDDVMGQDHITSVLRYECEHGKFSHAYLFCGSRGTGKTTCAKILAKAVNCTSPVNGSPCGKCPSCIAIEEGSTADVLEMDAASNNRVDDIREIRDEVIYSPTMLKYRVYIVDEVHMLTTSAFNALLKTLEEPPAHVVFILATTELHKLPSTIISRCQRFDFRRISIPVITERLLKIAENEGIGIDTGAAQLIARLAMGGMRDAVSLLELCAGARQHITETLVADSLGISGRDSTASLAEAIHNKDFEKIFATVAEVVSSSKDISVFVQDLLSFYRDMLVVKTSKDARKYLDFTESEMEQTERIASLFSKETLIYHCKLLDQTYAQIQRSVSSARLIAEMAFIKMCDEDLDDSSEALASRVAAIEDRLDAGLYTVQASPAPIAAPKNKAEKVEQTSGSDKTEEAKSEPAIAQSSGGKKRALTYWIEAVDKICRDDPSLTGFLKSSRIYRSENGNIVIRLESDFSKLMLTSRKSTLETLVKVLSAYEKRPMTEANIEFEVSHENDIIDEGRENLDEIINNFNTNSED
ncbi:MAG: DNA polymerase III subunit gamma/tau [Clostridia bacterium]|nr:DNA polymerase III subunit gamma/tau [Clostridia bacterium]